MGLCVHPALPWSGAGQAGIWGQAKNSFPWREPPLPLPDSIAPCPPRPGGGEGERALWWHLLAAGLLGPASGWAAPL